MRSLAMPAAAMHERAACGKCHDRTTAFGVEDAERCARCHVAVMGTP
jgi:c(7)-type cytochrome triheme protein